MFPVVRHRVSGRLGLRPHPPSCCRRWSSSPSRQPHGQRCPGAGLCSCSGSNVLTRCRLSFRSSSLIIFLGIPPPFRGEGVNPPLPPSQPSPGHLGSFDLFCKVLTQESFHFLFRSRHSHLNIALCRAANESLTGGVVEGPNASPAETEGVRACGAREEQASMARKKKNISKRFLSTSCAIFCALLCVWCHNKLMGCEWPDGHQCSPLHASFPPESYAEK